MSNTNSRAVPPLLHWKRACSEVRVTDHKDKSQIYYQGIRSDHCYVIQCGYVKLSQMTSCGQEHIVALLSTGDIFGIPLGTAVPSILSHTACTKGRTTLYGLPASCMQALLSDEGLLSFIMRSTNRRQQFLETRLRCLLSQNVRQRTATMLIELCTNFGGRCPHGHEIDIRLTQQEMSKLVGASRPVVSAIINQLRNEGYISYTREFICIDNIQEFQHMIDSEYFE